MCLAVLADNTAAQVCDPTGCNRDEPPLGCLRGIDLDLTNCPFKLRKRGWLPLALLHYLDLARENQLGETVRGEVVRLRARIFEYELIELARLETQLAGHKNMLPRSAQLHDHFDWVLACEVAASVCDACNQAD